MQIETRGLRDLIEEAVTQWGAKIASTQHLEADLVTPVKTSDAEHMVAVHIEPSRRAELDKVVDLNLRSGADFVMIVIDNDNARNEIASTLYFLLTASSWQRVFVIDPERVYSVLRWIEFGMC